MRKGKFVGSLSVLLAMTVFMSACLDSEDNSDYTQLIKEIQDINNYLAANPPTVGSKVLYDPSGVVIVFSQLGTGILPPNQGNKIEMAYEGSLLASGTVFQTNDYFPTFLKDNIIEGWKIALAQMTEGAIATVYIPSFYGYGKTGRSDGAIPIPGNATLVFELEMLSVKAARNKNDLTKDQVAILAKQVAAIDDTLERRSIQNIIPLDSGVRIVHKQIGTGSVPTLYDQVNISVEGLLLTDKSVFAPQMQYGPVNGAGSRLVNYVHGMIVGLQAMRVGGKATIYVPALLAYGSEARTGIPANSNLIFEVELLSIVN